MPLTSHYANIGALAIGLVLALVPAGASTSDDLIQPGVQVNGDCTLNFVYDGIGVNTGRVYIGTAAHCVDEVGESVSTNAHSDFGVVAYRGASHPDATDFALIEIKPEFLPFVSAEVKGHPGQPSGSTSSTSTERGDVLRFSGYGMGYDLAGPTQEGRVGVLESDTAEEWQAYASVMFGDSGGPVLHSSGEAIGIVASIRVSYGTSVPFVGASGPSVEGVLAHAAGDGFPVALRTV